MTDTVPPADLAPKGAGVPQSTELGIASQPTELASTDPAPDQVTDKYDPTKAGPSPYDDPEFQKDLKEGIAAQIEGWQKDWSIRIDALMDALGLSRLEVMMYLQLMQTGTIRGMASGFQHMWNAEPALRRRAMQDALLEAQLRDRGYAEEKKDTGVPISEAAKATAAQGWRIP